MVDVEQRALRALEQHRRAGLASRDGCTSPTSSARASSRGARPSSSSSVSSTVDATLGAERRQHARWRARHRAPRVGRAGRGAEGRAPARRAAPILSSYAGPMPRPVVPIALLARALPVEQLVVREHQVRAVAHVEATLHVDAVAHELVDLREQRLRIEHHAVADRAAHPGMQDAARDLVEDERRIADVDRVAGVRAALVAHHPVGALGEHVHELALALVAPLGADDDNGSCRGVEHQGWRRVETVSRRTDRRLATAASPSRADRAAGG